MGETTGISWTDATMNFWIGCTEAGAGCDLCYARQLATTRFGMSWGLGAPRHRTAPANWQKPLRWCKLHEAGVKFMKVGKQFAPVPRWVFTLSLGDFFDKEIDPQWRADAWQIIRKAKQLRWQIVTKRAPLIGKMLPDDWTPERYSHVGIIATVVDQMEIERDGPRLAEAKARHGIKWIGFSIEPQLAPVSIIGLPRVDWIITGGESKQGNAKPPRPYRYEWAHSLIEEGRATDTPVFVKQVGSHPLNFRGGRPALLDRAGADPDEWPEELRVQEMPRIYDEGARAAA